MADSALDCQESLEIMLVGICCKTKLGIECVSWRNELGSRPAKRDMLHT